ncbi:hypothetical protein HU200_001762 [Digitaria exilis]|uniref:Uncharacterized protein n=1 Tax=Digitaria exilis TaxID=1010633 RepID=A0A835FZK5_9POAL|nr:hypothetical protein HU200_001762 [Digitaria exilis]
MLQMIASEDLVKVAVIASNTPALYELHFSVPMVPVLLKHSDAKVFLAVAIDAQKLHADAKGNLPLVITISDTDSGGGGGGVDYEALLRRAAS